MMRTLTLLAVLTTLALAEGEERIDNIFRVWDTNQDGTLTRDEIPDKAIFAQVDTNKDGKITRDEVAAYVGATTMPKGKKNKKNPAGTEAKKKSVAAPPKPPRTIKERVADFFRRFDQNKDKKIQRKEFQAGEAVFKDWDRNKNDELSVREVTRYITAQLREAKKRPNPTNFFELYDTNRDKKVTRKEYDGPSDFFRRYDHDKNRVITEQEINMGPGAGMVMDRDKEFMKDGPTTAPKTGLLARYDKDKDGRITLEELKGAESVMNRLDRNGDGVLSGSEVR